jgi:DNA-binding winged helix-turn-helix (wHTH) protein
VEQKPGATTRRFGAFELDLEAEQLLKNGRIIRIQPQPFRLLRLLTNRPGTLVTREEIQAALWPNDTFVDFEQGVNFALKQVREALGDRAEASVYVQTVPKRGYRFLAPVTTSSPQAEQGELSDPRLQKAVWENIAELRLADNRRRRQQTILIVALACVTVVLAVMLFASL